MQDKKYYTPTIEEFHVGFEFELLTDDGLGDYYWSEVIFGNLLINKTGAQYSTDLKVVQGWIKDEEVQVPYLTKEDIEAEGYKMLFEVSPSGDTYFKKDRVTIWCDFKKHRIKVHYNDDGNNIVLFQSLADEDIKNKSELRKILKMIGV